MRGCLENADSSSKDAGGKAYRAPRRMVAISVKWIHAVDYSTPRLAVDLYRAV
jgi:hypothetical protein